MSHPCCNTCWMIASKAAACRRHSFPRVLTPSHFRPSSSYVPKFFPFWNPYSPDLATLDGIEQSASRKIHAGSPLAVKPSFADISLSCETPLRPMLRRPLGHSMNPLPVLMVAPRMACLLRRSDWLPRGYPVSYYKLTHNRPASRNNLTGNFRVSGLALRQLASLQV